MIDFLVVVVVFLLMSFTASGEPCIRRDLKVPPAVHAVDMIDAPLVSVAGERILVDGSSAGDPRAIEASRRVQRVDALFNLLRAKRELWKELHRDGAFPGTAILAIDGDVPSLVVKSVFQTAAIAGYPRISFMVASPSSGH